MNNDNMTPREHRTRQAEEFRDALEDERAVRERQLEKSDAASWERYAWYTPEVRARGVARDEAVVPVRFDRVDPEDWECPEPGCRQTARGWTRPDPPLCRYHRRPVTMTLVP